MAGGRSDRGDRLESNRSRQRRRRAERVEDDYDVDAEHEEEVEYEEYEYDDSDDGDYEYEEYEDDEYDDDEYDDDFEYERSRSSRGGGKARRRGLLSWRRLMLVVVILLLACLYFLPAIVVNSPMRQTILAEVNAKIAGEVECGGISAGWFSPIVVSDLKVVDEQQNQIAVVERFSTEQTLLQLLNDSKQARIHLQSPLIHVAVRSGGSNVEDLLRPLLEAPQEENQELQLEVAVANGRVIVSDTAGEEIAELSQLEALATFESGKSTLQWDAKGGLQSGGKSGQLASQGEATLGEANEGAAQWQVVDLPLPALRAAAVRLQPGLEIAGGLTSQGELKWDEAGFLTTFKEVEVTDFELAGHQMLQGDRLRSKRLTTKGSLYAGRDDVRCRQLEVVADWAKLTLSCDLQLGAIQQAAVQQDWRAVANATRGEAHGWVDIAKLSQSLPATIHLRDETAIHEGGLSFHIVNVEANGASPGPNVARKIDVQVDTQPVVAERAGQRIEWRDPIQLRAAATIDETGWSVEKMHCRSDFLTITGSGPPQAGEVSIEGDLGQLHRRLQQFIDMRGVELAGGLKGEGHWRKKADQLNVGGSLTATDFVLELNGNHWREREVFVSAAATMQHGANQHGANQHGANQHGANQAWEVANWRGQLVLGDETLAVQPDRDGYLVQISGDAKRWLAVGESFGVKPEMLEGLQAGRIDGQAVLALSDESLRVASSSLELQDLRFRSPDGEINIREPNVTATVSGEYRFTPQQWVTRQAEIRSGALAAASNRCDIRLAPQLQVDAAFSVRGDLERVSAWLPADALPYGIAGTVVGVGEVASLKSTGGASNSGSAPIVVRWDLSAERFAATSLDARRQPISPVSQPASRVIWREPNLRSQGQLIINPANQTVKVKEFECNTDWLAVATQGEVTLGESGSVDIKGAMTYDWPTTMKRLELTQGGHLKLYGQQSQTFSVRGPWSAASSGNSRAIAPDGLEAAAAIGWERAEAYGFNIGPATLRGQLKRGVVNFEPIKTLVNRGQATLTPQLDLRDEPAILSLQDGDGVKDIELTAEMCRGWLKYLAPLLADSTRAQGRLSLDLQQAAAPLNDFQQLQASGQLVVHEAQVGPGSLVNELLGPLQQILSLVDPDAASGLARTTWMKIPTQQIPFQVTRGRVHHKNLVLQIRDVQIKTSGSVGFDQSLDLLAEIPVLERWIAKNRYLHSLRGKSIPLRVRGNFGDPNIDESVLRQLAKESARGATEQLIQDQIERGLKKLFR